MRPAIVVDAMGGDYGATVPVRGAWQALAQDSNLKLILVGDSARIEAELKTVGATLSERLEVLHCTEEISMEDHAASAIRKKKDTSVHVGLKLIRDGKADAFISAGHSGAIMAGALLILGRMADVERPAIVLRFPTADGFFTLLDGGANVDCKAQHLAQFAEMGAIYAQTVQGIGNPRIALLSNGSEPHKGNELTRETDALLRGKKALNYRGYIEGFDLFRGMADVVVCDGFVGNIVLKLAEGLADTCFQWFRRETRKDLMGIAGVILMRRLLKRFKAKFDYQPYGAAPLLGIEGLVFIGHGSSTEVAIQNGILTARKAIEQRLVEKIRKSLTESGKKRELDPAKKEG